MGIIGGRKPAGPDLSAPANGATGVALSPDFSWTDGERQRRIPDHDRHQRRRSAHQPRHHHLRCVRGGGHHQHEYNSYAPPSALAAGIYYWQVQALEPSSEQLGRLPGQAFSASARPAARSAAPTLATPANGATAVSVPPTFTWSAITGNAGYRILVTPVQSALPTNASVGTCGGCSIGVTTSGTSYTPAASALAGGTTYYWEVQALSSTSGVYGTWSSISTFATGATDFSLSATPSSVTVAPGGTGTSTLTLAPVNNFSATPTFTCAASSSLVGVTCSVGTFSATNNTATVTITASSTAISYPALPRNPPFGGWWAVGLALLAVLLMALSRIRSSRAPEPWWKLRQVALGALLAALLLAALSCGGGSSSGGGGGGQTVSPPETGTVTITGTSTVSGTSTTLTHTASISVSVS